MRNGVRGSAAAETNGMVQHTPLGESHRVNGNRKPQGGAKRKLKEHSATVTVGAHYNNNVSNI